jgi:hypothetical protein
MTADVIRPDNSGRSTSNIGTALSIATVTATPRPVTPLARKIDS